MRSSSIVPMTTWGPTSSAEVAVAIRRPESATICAIACDPGSISSTDQPSRQRTPRPSTRSGDHRGRSPRPRESHPSSRSTDCRKGHRERCPTSRTPRPRVIRRARSRIRRRRSRTRTRRRTRPHRWAPRPRSQRCALSPSQRPAQHVSRPDAENHAHLVAPALDAEELGREVRRHPRSVAEQRDVVAACRGRERNASAPLRARLRVAVHSGSAFPETRRAERWSP
jgi:hypothetical protein